MIKAFFFDIAPWVAYAFFVIAPLIQTAHLIRRKQSGDISLSFLSLSLVAQLVLIPRLISITQDSLILIGHIASTTAGMIVLLAALYYRKHSR
ncbi:MAG: hypothetical protein Q7R62_00330 [bacterium]|nr:hypothetical protein [bacterium]